MARHLERDAIEVKLRRDTETEADAPEQLTGYLDLVMFDLRSTKDWAERLSTRALEHRGKRVHIIGC